MNLLPPYNLPSEIKNNSIIFEKTINLLPEEEDLFHSITNIHAGFPFYYKITTSQRYHQFTNVLLNRQKIESPDKSGIPNNPQFWPPIEKFFLRICKDNYINVKYIYRCAINGTTYHQDKHCDIHRDHDFEHYNFLMYLNDFNSGYTYLFDDKYNIKQTITPQKNKAVIFDGCWHAQGFCSPGQTRFVLIITFGT